MARIPENCFDSVADNESIRRYFLSRYRDPETNQWGMKVFELRAYLNPPEYFISFSRIRYSPDPITDAERLYSESKKRLKTIEGYSEINVESVRKLSFDTFDINVLAVEDKNSPHAGIFSWIGGSMLLDANSDLPEFQRLQMSLLDIALPNYKDFPKEVTDRWQKNILP